MQQPTATARAPTTRDLTTALTQRIHAELSQATTQQQVAAYEEALRHIKGVQRALDKATLVILR